MGENLYPVALVLVFVAVFVALESDRGAAVTISLMMVIVSVVLLVVLRDRWWGAS